MFTLVRNRTLEGSFSVVSKAILRVNIDFEYFFKFYKICTRLSRSNSKKSTTFRQKSFCILFVLLFPPRISGRSDLMNSCLNFTKLCFNEKREKKKLCCNLQHNLQGVVLH